MTELTFTLISDGSSDQALIPIISWLFKRLGVQREVLGRWPDFGLLPSPPTTLSEKIDTALELFPCDVLFVHRDAERVDKARRRDEILRAVSGANVQDGFPVICVIPVRMQEAWLIFDVNALRRAAGNPNGTESLELPALRSLEGLPNPKEVLHELLRKASGLRGRRCRHFPVDVAVRRIVDFIEDFTPLLGLAAFSILENDVRNIVVQMDWEHSGD